MGAVQFNGTRPAVHYRVDYSTGGAKNTGSVFIQNNYNNCVFNNNTATPGQPGPARRPETPVQHIVHEAARGAARGAKVGAAIGLVVGGPVGAVVGGAIGTVVGGVAGAAKGVVDVVVKGAKAIGNWIGGWFK